MVCLAYLTYFADCYFRKDAVVPEHVFCQVRERYLQGKELNDTCRLALLKYLAFNGAEDTVERKLADSLLDRYVRRGICFEFYQKFEEKLLWKYQLYDKFFVEYHTEPAKRVRIYYHDGTEDYQEENMTEMYPGIYVQQFVLFFGESVQYYVTEEAGGEKKVTESNCIRNYDVLNREKSGRYVKLNEMLMEDTLQEREQLHRHMKQYCEMQKITEELFRLL